MIADRIKLLREQSGLSQAQLAKRLNVTRSSVNAWEQGISMPTVQYVVEMAKTFRVTTDFILDMEQAQSIKLSGLTEEELNLIYGLLQYFDQQKEKK